MRPETEPHRDGYNPQRDRDDGGHDAQHYPRRSVLAEGTEPHSQDKRENKGKTAEVKELVMKHQPALLNKRESRYSRKATDVEAIIRREHPGEANCFQIRRKSRVGY